MLTGINNSGQIVGRYQNSSGAYRYFVYKDGTYTDLDVPVAAPLDLDINDTGQIVINTYPGPGSDGHEHLIYSDGNYVPLKDFYVGLDLGINNAGQIVGSYRDSGDIVDHSFLATPAAEPADQLFSDAGGKIVFLAKLANAAYHLGSLELSIPGYNNSADQTQEDDYRVLSHSIKWLNTNIPELSGLVPSLTGDQHYPDTGLSFDGVYTNRNAAALVGRSADSLFIGFRGTNDYTGALDVASARLGAGTPDVDDWFSHDSSDEGMDNYYALLQPLFSALNGYINNPANGISHVYVTGHSLGAAVVQRYLHEH
jgi:probable HAF family extracellular repeat protein